MNRQSNKTRILGGVLLSMALTLGVGSSQAQEGRKALSNPAPTYPDVAKKLRLVGTVKVQVVIGADGKIKGTTFVGGHPVLVNAVEETLKNWKFAPSSGETTMLLEFNFHP